MIDRLLDLYRRYKPRKYGWSGNYKDWETAKSLCEGYDDKTILDRIIQSTLRVKNGEYAWELDGVNHQQIYYSWPLLAHLMMVAAKHDGHLALIDFGGSLGTTYFQNRKYLNQLKKVNWTVVEQPHFVKAGRELLTFENLDFKETIDLAFKENGKYTTFLMSGVLPYLDESYEFLNQLKCYGFETIIIDNTYYNNRESDRICIQKVDPIFYGKEIAYQCRFLNYDKVMGIFLDKYELFQEYETGIELYLDHKTIRYKSMVLDLK
ncbi:MAG: methyltransferase, TIGR04325 family [Sphingobacteriales bacterium]|nr:methyltransferase, TIGR04325 family [Sphingobacteriales bacterium]